MNEITLNNRAVLSTLLNPCKLITKKAAMYSFSFPGSLGLPLFFRSHKTGAVNFLPSLLKIFA